MRPIRLAKMDKTRPVVVLTRPAAIAYLSHVTVAPITSRIRGIATEVAVGSANGLDRDSVVSLDNITTISVPRLGRQVGFLLAEQEDELSAAIRAAFELS